MNLRARLRETFQWLGDRTDEHRYADVTGWWRDPELLTALGPALAELFDDEEPTVVLGLETRGFVLGPLVATALGVGFVEVRKSKGPANATDRWLRATTPPDYRYRQLTLGIRAELLRPADRVLAVDEWIDTGGQALAVRSLVEQADATWLGIAVIVDALDSHQVRLDLGVRALLNDRDL